VKGRSETTTSHRSRRSVAVALVLWGILLLGFWWQANSSELGALTFVAQSIEGIARQPWAPLSAFALYLVRPLLLIPITIVNIAAGFVLGAVGGMALAAAGTLASATIGYGMGRGMGGPTALSAKLSRGRIPQTLRRHGFLSVAVGGLMYLHADAVNFPAGALRIPFPTFMAGIVVGNSLTMTAAVLTGASIDGQLLNANLSLDGNRLILAGTLFAISIALALALRKRLTSRQVAQPPEDFR
jgi:uncharacterized membrane protein YdjX (TVP38/TMEM64 family)